MPVTYYTQDEWNEMVALLRECAEHIEHGPATHVAMLTLLRKIAVATGHHSRVANIDAILSQKVHA